MHKREITYEDFNGDTVTEIFYFNIAKSELVELEVEREGGFAKWLERLVETKDHKQIIEQFKRIVLLAYGQKSEDGKRFVKNDQLREEFSQTAAYETLFMELATNDDAAILFLKGALPKDISESMVANGQTAPVAAPPAPPPVSS